MIDNESGEPFLGTRYYFLMACADETRPLLIVATDIGSWLQDPVCNGRDGKFVRLIGIARGHDDCWIWQSDDWSKIVSSHGAAVTDDGQDIE